MSERPCKLSKHKREISDIASHPEFFKDSLAPSDEENKRPSIINFRERESIEYDEREFVMSTQEGHLQNFNPKAPNEEAPNGYSINLARQMPSSAKRLLTSQNNRAFDGDTSFSRELYRPESTRPDEQSPMKTGGKRSSSMASRGVHSQQQLD